MSQDLPPEEIALQPPPALPRDGGNPNYTQLLFMLPMMLGMGAMSFVYIGRSNGPMTMLFGALFAGSMIGTLALTFSRPGLQRRAQLNTDRRDYLRYLAGLRKQVHATATRQRDELSAALPTPESLWLLPGTQRLWPRRATDLEFGRIRIATGPQLLATPLRAPQTAPLEDLDPVSSSALRRFIRVFGTVPALPVAVSLRAFSRITVEGEREAVLDLARAMLAQLAAFHSPGTLRIACCAGPQRLPDWEWLKWLPHALDGAHMDAAGPMRLAAKTMTELVALLGTDVGDRPRFAAHQPPDAGRPHLVVILDGGNLDDLSEVDGLNAVTLLDVGGWPREPSAHTLALLIDGDRLGMRTSAGVRPIGAPDRLSAPAAQVLARRMTPLFTNAAPTHEGGLNGNLGLADLLGIGDPRAVDPVVTWRPRPATDRLRIPIGVDPAGRPVELDLKESAEGGMGPHGLIIGATGSGKSELLRTLVTGLVVTHSSEVLNLALIDFKGGATFAGMTDLPHTCAVITNLAEDLTLVDRMGDALRGELVRRQELLRAAGNYAAVRDYEKARLGGAALQPLPSLLVIIDEFSELLSSRPEFIDLFVMIGRLGRSLGIHLLLASQNLDEGRLRGLDTHLSYRVALRTFSSSASRAVIGVPDAYELPPVPGSAYLRVDTNTLLRFKSAYVSGGLAPQRFDETQPTPFRHRAVPFLLASVVPAGEPAPAPAMPVGGETVMEAMLGRLMGRGPAAHQIWLPPLSSPSTLDGVLPGLADTPERGFTLSGWTGNGRLTVPVAIVDKPFEQRRDLLWADLSGAAGHAVVVGGPQSGKSTLLRTLICSLALTHTPAEAQFFLLDLGGGALSTLAGLPHVSGCSTRLDTEGCRRTIAELTALLADRERFFAELGIDSMAAFRRGPVTPAGGRHFGDVFLVIDGWMTLRQEYEELEERITALAARGLGYGIHVILSANRWMELRAALRDLLGTQFELRLGEPADSVIDRRAAAGVPIGAPGRGLTHDKLQFLTALPRVDARPSTEDIAAGVADLIKRIDSGWRGPRAPRLRLLPTLLPAAQLPTPVPGERRLPLGLAESDLAPVFADFDADAHFLAFGDTESGKTGLLRLVAHGICAGYTPAQAAIMVVDYRRGLLGAVDDAHLLGYCGTEQSVTEAVAQVQRAMAEREPGPHVSREQLRDRSWWSGPEVFILVDDYDLVATQTGNPLAPLAPFLALASDIGLHLVVVRRSGGAARAMFDPLLQRLRDLASPGLILSGSREEGALLGTVKPSPQPPGRGQLVGRRTGSALVQLAWLDPR